MAETYNARPVPADHPNRAFVQTEYHAIKRALSPTGRTVTASVTSTHDDILLCDATAAAFTVTLAPRSAWRRVSIKKIDSSAHAITIQGSLGKTIDGSASLTISTQYTDYTLVADDSGKLWVV